MKTITKEEFFNRFLKISNELTFAEVRLLYLLITEPYIIELSQQEIADRLETHRRTINIGLKRLRKLNYIADDTIIKESTEFKSENIDNDTILKSDQETAMGVVIAAFKRYYPVQKKDFIINEDFFSYIIGDLKLPEKYRHDRPFIIQVISEEFPDVRFYFDQKISSYSSYINYYVMNAINSKIIEEKKKNKYRIKLNSILMNIYDNFSIDENEALRIIRKEFPRVRLSKGHISIRLPYGNRIGLNSKKTYDNL